MSSRAALLLDIDGVLVAESSHAGSAGEVLLLHQGLRESLQRLQGSVFLVTHRSRAEAHRLIQCAGLRDSSISQCFTANDYLRSALRTCQFVSLARSGLRKSLILPVLSRRYGVDAGRMCFVDDRAANVQDMVQHGVGLGLIAPSIVNPGSVVTFDFDDLVARFNAWALALDSGAEARLGVQRLAGLERELAHWQRTGTCVDASSSPLFNLGRRVWRAARRSMAG